MLFSLLFTKSQHYPKIARFYATLVMVISFIVLVFGWLYKIGWLTNLLPHLASMVPSTALSLYILGYLVFKVTITDASIFDQLLLGLVIALVSANMVFFAYGLKSGIDGLFFIELQSDRYKQMSIATGICLLLVSICLELLFNLPKTTVFPTKLIAITGLFVTFLVFLAYAIDVDSLYRTRFFEGLAIHTTLSFMLLFASVLYLCSWRQD